MKTLIFSDLHLHNYSGFGIDFNSGLSKRLLEQQNILNQISEIIIKEKIEGVLFLGDLFHSVGIIPVEPFNIANAFFNSLKIPYYLVPGNHDLINRETPKWYQYSGKIFSKYTPPENIKLIGFHEKIDYNIIRGYDIVAIHQTPINAKIGNYIFKEGFNWQELSKNNKLVLIGHIHQRQQLASNCIIVGSPLALTFSDTNERGVYIVEDQSMLGTGDLKVEFVKLDYSKFITVNTLIETKEDGNYYRVLESEGKSENPNVVTITKPKFFEERLKSETFQEILNEWLAINNKDTSYLETVKDIIKDKFLGIGNVFKGKLVAVKIKNFISIEEIKYTIEEGFTLVRGKNGVGKSSLFEAIYWCLFGETTKELIGDDVIRKGQKNCEVVLALVDGTTKIKIFRDRKEGIRIWVQNDVDCQEITEGLRKDDKQKCLESLLGIDKNIFLSACYFSQENLKMLTNMGNSDKTNMITNLLGFEQYDDLYEGCHNKQKELNINLSIDEGRIKDLIKDIQVHEYFISDLNKRKNNIIEDIKKTNLSIEHYQEKIQKLNSQQIVEEKIEVIDYDSQLINLDSEILDLENQFKIVDNFELNIKLNDLKINISILERDSEHVFDEISELNEYIQELDSVNIGTTCEKCGSIVSEENKEKLKIEKIEKINSLNENKIKIVNQLEKLNLELQEGLIQFKNNNFSIQNINTKLSIVRSNIKEINNLKFKQLEQIKINENRKNKIILEQKEYVKFIEVYDEKIKKHNEDIREYDLNILDTTGKKMLTQTEHCELLQIKEESLKNIAILDFWKTAFSSRGIRSLLLDKFCNQMNIIINKYIALISNNKIEVIMNPTKTIKSGEERNEINLDIILNGTQYNYKNLSGGQKRRIDAALCFALNSWVSKKYNISNGLLGIIILDELFSYLDGEAEESIGNLVYDEGKNKGIYVISHALSLESFASKIWTVSEDHGISKINFN